MLGRLAAIRIKAAEDAFDRGRFDESFEIASAVDLANHRRARGLLRKLVDPFLERGQDHLLSMRFTEALADFERAARCGHKTKKVAEWRKRAMDAMQDDQQVRHERDAAIAAARDRLAAGSLHNAADALAKAPDDDPDRAVIADEIARRSKRAEEALAAAKAALKDGQLAQAVARWRAAKALHSGLDGVHDMETKLVAHAVKLAAADFKDGRLERAEQQFHLLDDAGRTMPERIEMDEALRLAREAAKALSDDRYARASVLLGRLTQVGPKAAWIGDVRKHLSVLEDHRRALLEGPLGLISGHNVPSAVGAKSLSPAKPFRGDATLPAAERPVAKPAMDHRRDAGATPPRRGRLPRRLLLRIDGAGSFLLLRGDRIGIGRSGPGATADLPLVSDLSERQAEVIRAGEDYFVVSKSGVELAGRNVDHALLQDGDRIRLGNRIRLKFRRPSLKSTTAILDLGDGVRTTTDCRRVILWGGPLLMGGTRECHIRLSPSLGGAILMERNGQLCIKPMGPGGQAVPVELGVQTELGELRLTAKPWSDESGGGKVIA